MSNDIVERIRRTAEGAAVEAVWSQWSALTPLATPTDDGQAWTQIDPEALVLASLALSPLERRLEDLVAAWARDAGFLMSKPRFRTVATHFPDDVEARIGDFARYATEGGDARWKSWARPATGDPAPRPKSLGPLRLTDGPSLALRLRAAFGISAKADILAILLGLDGAEMNLTALTAAAGYSERMIRTATAEMTLAGFLHEVEGRPSSFWVKPEPWSELLYRFPPDPSPERTVIPPWTFWSAVLGFLCDVTRWAERAKEKEWTDYVATSRARDLFDDHAPRLRQAGLRISAPPPAGQAERSLEAFHELVTEIAEWTIDRLGRL